MKRKKLLNRVLNLFNLELSRVPPRIFKNVRTNITKKEYALIGDEILFKKLSLQMPMSAASPLLNGYQHAIRISEQLKGIFSYNKEGLQLTIGKARFFINDHEELFIINEVFTEGGYNIISQDQNIIVVDIGMNVGIASIFFSLRENVKKIYSYELFPPTFDVAIRNITINQSGSKIIPHSFGLGKNDEKLQLPYSIQEKGRMGILGLPVDGRIDKSGLQEVEIRNVSREIEKISSENKDSFIICKMDCEGAEYDLIEDLYKTKLMEKIKVFMIEWHYKDPAIISNQLVDKGFLVFCYTFPTDYTGMIYAVRENSSAN